MNDFQDQLNEEIEKRELEETSDQPEEKTAPVKKKQNTVFSFSSFLKGTIVCLLFFAGMLCWAAIKSSDTRQIIKDKLASKTAVVKKAGANTYRASDVQPVLRMPSAREENSASIETSNATNSALIESVSSGDSLVAAPVPGLYESSGSGLLPIPRQEDGLTAFEAYKRPFKKNTDQPLLSIVVTDLGLSRQKTEQLIQDLPPDVTLAFSPYSRNLKLLTDVARSAGHEVWLTLPMETKDYPVDDPGPSTLLVNASVEQNKSRLTSLLASTQGYAGFISQKNHVFRQEDAEVNPSVQEIFGRGLAILDSNTSVSSFVGRIAAKNDYPHAKNNFWLDEKLTPIALNQKIRQAIEYGQGTGRVVLMLHPYPASLKTLNKFLSSAAAKEFQIAPVSAQVVYGE